jgi:glucose/arabinose dehydrogenase
MPRRTSRELLAVAVAAASLALALAAAGAGATAAPRAGALRLAKVGSFDSPVYVADAPGSPKLLFVVEQPGMIEVSRGGKTLKRPFLNLRHRVLYGGEQGLLSVAFDPGYARNRRFYVYYVNRDGNIEVDGLKRKGGISTRAEPRSRRKVIEIPHPTFENHNGGQLQFGPDGLLYMATGDGGSGGDPHGNAQNPNVLLGKLLRIDPRKKGGYSTPNSNPFVGQDGRDEIYALGLRNPYRFSFDSASGDILIGDVGQDSWEEVDRVGQANLGGSNFGWDLFEGNHDFDGDGTEPANYRPPVLEYSSAGSANCAVTGGYVVHDPSLPALDGRYLYADFCGGVLRSFDPSNPEPSDAATGLEVGEPSSFGEGAGGRIYVASLGGSVSRIVQK